MPSLLETVVLGVGFGRGFSVETTYLDESCSLLSVSSTYVFEVFAEREGVIEKGVANCHTTGRDLQCG